MHLGERDPITGRTTTGHEWNGIKELNTPIPKVVLFFLVVGALFAVGYWLLMPAWPLGTTYTKGLLGNDQRQIVTEQVEAAKSERAAWMDKIGGMDFAAIQADPDLMKHVMETGRTLFVDNCAACHGVTASGGPGFPNLSAKAWLWGGEPQMIAETFAVGINSTNDDTRVSEMPAFGRDGLLKREQIVDVVAYVRSLSECEHEGTPNEEQIAAGREVFKTTCASCHGEDGKGLRDVGAPNLTDGTWIYGAGMANIHGAVYGGRKGHMPHWRDRLTPEEIKLLALYVQQLGTAK